VVVFPGFPTFLTKGGVTKSTAIQNTSCWRADLEASRDLKHREKAGFAMLLGWLEKWRVSRGLEPGVEAAWTFWKAQVSARSAPASRRGCQALLAGRSRIRPENAGIPSGMRRRWLGGSGGVRSCLARPPA